ncbi:MAG: hypothetical protein HZB38_19545 [Planctomycetes bacterium]|nr:hypothetical protein [Planctomycetota bacterium]
MDMRSLFCKALLPLGIVAVVGCENKPPPPPPSPTPASQPSKSDEAALKEFLAGGKTAQPAAGGGSGAALPAGHPPISGSGGGPARPAQGAAPAPTGKDLLWKAPADWQPTPPASSMRRAQYALPRAEGDAADGEMVVFYFGQGEGGTVKMNLDRWRGQFSTSSGEPLPADAGTSEAFEANGMKITLLELDGRFSAGSMTGGPAAAPLDGYRMIGAVVETKQGPWFFKATGPKATIEKQKAAIREMLQNVKEPE